MINRKVAFSVTAVLVLILAACSTTRLAGSWQDESLAGKKFKNILIIGAAKQPDIRQLFEDEFARQLNAKDVKTISSYTIFPADKMLDKSTIAAKVYELEVDGVLVTRLTELKKKREMSAGSTYRVPYGYYNQMHEYYRKGFEPGESSPLTTHKVVTLETNIYSAETEKLVWATTSDVQVQDKVDRLTKDFIRAVVNKLLSDKVI